MRQLTVLLASAAIGAAGAQSAPKTLQVMWQAGGGDTDSSFADISMIAVGRNGEVATWDRKSNALRLFNDAGKLVRVVGRKGAGPGEYNGISGMAWGSDNRFYVWDSGNARLNVYRANGDFEK